jgi:excisionase family DNA binding protein
MIAWLQATIGAILPTRRRAVEDLGWLTLAEAARRYGVPHGTLRNAIRIGKLTGRLVGKTYLVQPIAVEAYLRTLRPRPSRRRPVD